MAVKRNTPEGNHTMLVQAEPQNGLASYSLHEQLGEIGASLALKTVETDLHNYTKTLGVADVIAKGPWVDVRAFGAMGDGVTDDTAAIQAAIDSKVSIFVPPGTYLISSMLTLLNSGSQVVGIKGKSILMASGTNAIIGPAVNGAAEYVLLKGITFTSKTGGQGTGIYSPGNIYVSHWTIDECNFTGKLDYGVNGTIIACKFDRCLFGLTDYGFAFHAIRSVATAPLFALNENVFSGCEFAACRNVDNVVYLSYGNKVVFEDTIFEQCSATNSIIYLEGITNPVFSRVWIEACNAPSFIKTSLFEGQDCYVLSLISSHFNLSGTGFSPSIACVDFDNTSNKNIRVIDCLISSGTAPLVSAGVTYIEKSGNFSTTAGHSLLPNAPAFFGSGISSPNAAVSTLVASAHCASPLFYSFVVTLSATASPAPIYTFPTVSKTSMYLVSAASYRNDATNYSAFAVVATDLNTGRLVLNNGSVGVVLTISGLVLSAASNGDVEISMSILQIA